MTTPTAHKVLGSALFVTIAATLTEIPGLENLKINMGEKEAMSRQALNVVYASPTPSGTHGEQSFTADMIWDPLDPVHQFLHISFNPDADPDDDTSEIIGKVKFGETGVEQACKFFLTKFDIDLKKGAGQMVSMEGKFTEQLLLNEADPA